MRTILICQAAIAATDVASLGPSKIPQPCAQAYSVPDRFTPCKATVLLLASTMRFPMTRKLLNPVWLLAPPLAPPDELPDELLLPLLPVCVLEAVVFALEELIGEVLLF